jgi:N-acetyl-anhydromuramyl-L-alanine amidase AmpD
VIRSSDGYTKQLVKDEDTAYHARCWNPEAIGIEHEGFVDRPGKYYTSLMYRTSARLVRYLTAKFDIPRTNLRIVGHDLGDTDLIRRTGLEDCNTHPDPGTGWDWTRYLGLVAGR